MFILNLLRAIRLSSEQVMGIKNKGKKIVIKPSKDDAKSSEPIIRDSHLVSDDIRSKLETAGIQLTAKTTYAKLKNHSINNELLIAPRRSTSFNKDTK